MKYLKLTNTEECLKLAECLIGSECYTDKGILDLSTGGYDLDSVHYCVDDCEWDKNEFVLFDETHRNFSKHILVPLEAIKVNPFKAMEHQIRVLVENKYFEEGDRERIKDGRIKSIGEKPSPKNENEFEIAISIEQLPFKMIDEKWNKLPEHFGGGCWLKNGNVKLDIDYIVNVGINGAEIITI